MLNCNIPSIEEMSPAFEAENKEIIRSENEKIDQAIDVVLEQQKEKTESVGYDQSLHR